MFTDIYQRLKEVLFGALILFILVAIPSLKQFTDPFSSMKVITVSAEGKVTAVPDIAKTSFSVVSEGPNPKTVQDENNSKMSKAIADLKSLGIDDKDIKTTGYDLSPTYSYDQKTGKSWIYGYRLTQTVSVKVRDFGKISDILTKLSDAGINQVSGFSFDVDDPEKYLTEARNQAFDKAKSKAQSMALQNGVTLGKALNFSESGAGTPGPIYAFAELGKGGSASSAPTIEPGSQEVKIQVVVTYEIK